MSTASQIGQRVGLIGPVLPFRGGIAQHTTLLARALAQRSECLVLSFQRQYPGWCFPGATDRDAAYRGYQEPGVQYVIDSLNPLTWRQAARQLCEFAPAFVLLPWWTVYWTPLYSFLVRKLRRAGIPVVFLCHNVLDHEGTRWKEALTRSVLRGGTRHVVHTNEELRRLRALIRDARVTVHPHPVYDQFPEPSAKLPRRANLELLFFGFVRPYKALDTLLNSMARLKGDDVFLTVAGEFWGCEAGYRQLIGNLGIAPQIEVIARYVTEQETANLFDRADVVVLPYRQATGSGVVPVAYRYGRPVIVTDVGGLGESVLPGETGEVVPSDRADLLADAIARMTRERAAGMRPAVAAYARSLTWNALAAAVLAGNG